MRVQPSCRDNNGSIPPVIDDEETKAALSGCATLSLQRMIDSDVMNDDTVTKVNGCRYTLKLLLDERIIEGHIIEQFKWTCREQFCKRILFEDFQDALLT